MSLCSVRAELARIAPDLTIEEHGVSTATVQLAADAHGVPPSHIAKTLSLRVGETVLLVVVRGDARLDNRKARAAFGGKARMLDGSEVEAITGHPVGGVCPFGLAWPIPVYCDVSDARFRRGRAGGWLDELIDPDRTSPPRRADRRVLGRRLPGDRLTVPRVASPSARGREPACQIPQAPPPSRKQNVDGGTGMRRAALGSSPRSRGAHHRQCRPGSALSEPTPSPSWSRMRRAGRRTCWPASSARRWGRSSARR